jgi:hypothetical protein
MGRRTGYSDKATYGRKIKNRAVQSSINMTQAIKAANFQIHLREQKLDWTQAMLRISTNVHALENGAPPPMVI